MKKLAVIRGQDIAGCPYGLKITSACNDVGDTIFTMQALDYVEDDAKDKALKNNLLLYLTQKTKERCPFANAVMKQFDRVDCSFGDAGAGEGTMYMPASPYAPSIYVSNRPDSQAVGPLTYDPREFFEATDRGIDTPYGLFSLFALQFNQEALIKIAISKPTNNLPNIQSKMALLKDRYFDVLKLIIRAEAVKLNTVQLEEMLIIINEWA